MSTNKVFLDFHVFDIPEGEEFVLIGQPIEPLVNPNGDRATLEIKVGKEKILVSLVCHATPLQRLDRSKTHWRKQ